MKNTNFLLIMLLIVGIVLGFTYESSDTDSDDKTTTENTTTASEENTEPFDKMMQVLTHKRCVRGQSWYRCPPLRGLPPRRK